MNKFIFIMLMLISISVNAQQAKKKSTNDNISKEELKQTIDSLLKVKFEPLEKALLEERLNLQKRNSDLIRYESSFWKDYTNWLIAIFGILLGLVPISIGIIEYYKSNTKKKLKSLEQSIKSAQQNINDFNQFQTYQELYFEDVLKPTINNITDILLELSLEEKIDISLVEEITDKYYDFERVINLTHCNAEIKNSAIEYISNRNSDYLKIKLETLLNNGKMEDGQSDLKLLVHRLLEKYRN